ncbi:MAG TPA: COX15/CtaA family protein [Jatrophihabitans sp.]|jgi:cytochrome c oxidase assembly protein subunit 15|uniref:COX15/CtaA family protein n=1 Tax=Jatrophihabitans sp. TaxID=1932789 RepID=UPI002F0DCDB7
MGVSEAGWLRAPATLRRLALATLVANVLIVVTGGAVRLTGSGLGCPTWPSCTEDSLTPTPEYAAHGVIEFANRQLTFVLSAVVLATLIVAVLARRQVKLAALVAASIPAQAVLGGITVLTGLNPWTVAAHFLLSMLIIAIAFALWWRLRDDAEPTAQPTGPAAADSAGPAAAGLRTAGQRSLRAAATVIVTLTAAVLAIGTVVTGSGPHAGDKGATNRIDLDPASVSQLHADVVLLLIGLTLGFAVLAQAAGASQRLRRAAWLLLAVELAQGLIGFVQYFTHVPALLVGVHMLGACLVWLAALAVLAHALAAPARTHPAPAKPLAGQRR